jgi:exodeoxyribonuclease VII large subunit
MAAKNQGDARQGTLAGLWLPPKRTRAAAAVAEAASAPALGSAASPWSVAELVAGIRLHVEREYQDVWVAGEISNCRPAPSGHVYFTLKDGEAQLPVVLFRRQAQLLRFRPQDGLAVLARGRVSIYDSRGQLQLIAETLEPRGAGALQLAFERLKTRLLAEGLFDAARKRPLPAFPRCVGVVTSTAGAVLHDIVKVVRRRHACLNILVYPATMQGPSCAGSVAAGIQWFNDNPGAAEVVVIARGGGSIEDLAGFNDEALARTIAGSKLPVVSAIGHETDFTIADFVADLRAPTPSAAAELITAAQHRIEERVEALDARLRRAVRYQVTLARQRLGEVSVKAIESRMAALLGRRVQRVDDLGHRLRAALVRGLRVRTDKLASVSARLERQNPAMRVAVGRTRLERGERTLARLARAMTATPASRLDRARARLQALSPVAVLSRGYAIVYDADGQVLRDARVVRKGQKIRARLGAGSLTAEVEAVELD